MDVASFRTVEHSVRNDSYNDGAEDHNDDGDNGDEDGVDDEDVDEADGKNSQYVYDLHELPREFKRIQMFWKLEPSTHT